MKAQRIYFHRVGGVGVGQEDRLDIPLGDDPFRHVASALIHRVLVVTLDEPTVPPATPSLTCNG